MTFNQHLINNNVTRAQLSTLTGTPMATVYSWANGTRNAPKIAWWAVEQLGKETK